MGSDQANIFEWCVIIWKQGPIFGLYGRFHSQKGDYSRKPPMARAKRHYFPGQIWPLTHRCHKREFLLKFSKDHHCWLQWLYEAKKRYNLKILDYMVTSTHIHLLVKTMLDCPLISHTPHHEALAARTWLCCLGVRNNHGKEQQRRPPFFGRPRNTGKWW